MGSYGREKAEGWLRDIVDGRSKVSKIKNVTIRKKRQRAREDADSEDSDAPPPILSAGRPPQASVEPNSERRRASRLIAYAAKMLGSFCACAMVLHAVPKVETEFASDCQRLLR